MLVAGKLADREEIFSEFDKVFWIIIIVGYAFLMTMIDQLQIFNWPVPFSENNVLTEKKA